LFADLRIVNGPRNLGPVRADVRCSNEPERADIGANRFSQERAMSF
jgi:hypothetical protein